MGRGLPHAGRREVREETGLEVEIRSILSIASTSTRRTARRCRHPAREPIGGEPCRWTRRTRCAGTPSASRCPSWRSSTTSTSSALPRTGLEGAPVDPRYARRPAASHEDRDLRRRRHRRLHGRQAGAAGVDVTLIARGPHLAAMQANGLRLIEDRRRDGRHAPTPRRRQRATPGRRTTSCSPSRRTRSRPRSTPSRRCSGPRPRSSRPRTACPGGTSTASKARYSDRRLESVDPGGRIWDAIGPQRVIGCVVYPACEIEAPGVIRHIDDNRFSLGEPDGSPLRARRGAGAGADRRRPARAAAYAACAARSGSSSGATSRSTR